MRSTQGESAWGKLLKSRLSLADFEIVRIIGKGAFGEVMLVRKRDTKEVLAMKKLIKSEMLKKKQTQHVRAERNILANSENPVRYEIVMNNLLHLIIATIITLSLNNTIPLPLSVDCGAALFLPGR